MISLLKSKIFPNVLHETLFESCLDILTQTLHKQLLNPFSWRLAANAERLANSVVVPVWQVQPVDEWCALEVLGTRHHYTKTRRRGVIANLVCLSGFPASKQIDVFWSDRMLYAVKQHLGFSKYPSGKNPLLDFSQIVKMRLFGLALRGEDDGRLIMTTFDFKNQFQAYNREWIKLRNIDTRDCPHSFKIPCHSCFCGYKTKEANSCQFATHPTTFITGMCERCGLDSFLDPDSGNRFCHRCRIANMLRQIGDPP